MLKMSFYFCHFTTLMERQYDYIICGGGCAGLSLAYRLLDQEFRDKKILVIDKSDKQVNDRTWSFWTTKKEDLYEDIYYKTWHKLAFHVPDFSLVSDPVPYKYNTIKSIDFYRFVLEQIEQSSHIQFLQADITSQNDHEEYVEVETSKGTFRSSYVFDSVVRSFPERKELFVWQHFLGWEVKFNSEVFDDSTATFMDFRVEQDGDTIFVYVLPFTKQTALIEATFFSKKILEQKSYEAILQPYIQQHYGSDYDIVKKEIGAIPMTTEPFSQGSKRIIPIGTNNGTVKPSSGYAFMRIQRECDELIRRIRMEKVTRVKASTKFLAYDRTLLNVLISGKESGQRVFGLMFKRNAIAKILKFLNEDSSLIEETAIFRTLPFWSFLRAFVASNVKSLTK